MREFSTDDLDALLLDRDDLAVFLSAGVVEERRLRFRLTILGLPGPDRSLSDVLLSLADYDAGEISITARDAAGPVVLDYGGGGGTGSDELIRHETDLWTAWPTHPPLEVRFVWPREGVDVTSTIGRNLHNIRAQERGPLAMPTRDPSA